MPSQSLAVTDNLKQQVLLLETLAMRDADEEESRWASLIGGGASGFCYWVSRHCSGFSAEVRFERGMSP